MHGTGLGAEFVDLEGNWSGAAKGGLLKSKGMSRIIASYHDFTDKFYSTAEISKIFKDLRNGGQSDIVKVHFTREGAHLFCVPVMLRQCSYENYWTKPHSLFILLQVAIKTPKPSQLAEMEYAVQTFM